ncbi:maleylpyruvate isomerase N-terminal domain-containing protein [Paracoccus aerodenitrificans]|uniref:maleylpyruvate isomerase N-terminal domain-containing protein n=1 Tax=Paracoccus aerodenitrificans TaxID=3017781 RepID=UPI0022F04536|nr:maleylpyruvate isomerase N-terminal domain-containing protein [Paracoccus aerodenitrificans]WBU64188.1 maleylpyruvate isomerase N-terminal domain-containing protein [Paracoccus aerodenitrificans]
MSDLDRARADLRAQQGAGARYDSDAAPAEALHIARRGVAYMARLVNQLDEAALWQGSARPGWTRRRIIAANALQAREIAQALEDATGQQGDRADTSEAAVNLAETLPSRALRHLASHADIHLNVVWRDLTDEDWDLPVTLSNGSVPARETADLRAQRIWQDAMDLGAGGRLRDVPAILRDRIAGEPH